MGEFIPTEKLVNLLENPSKYLEGENIQVMMYGCPEDCHYGDDGFEFYYSGSKYAFQYRARSFFKDTLKPQYKTKIGRLVCSVD